MFQLGFKVVVRRFDGVSWDWVSPISPWQTRYPVGLPVARRDFCGPLSVFPNLRPALNLLHYLDTVPREFSGAGAAQIFTCVFTPSEAVGSWIMRGNSIKLQKGPALPAVYADSVQLERLVKFPTRDYDELKKVPSVLIENLRREPEWRPLVGRGFLPLEKKEKVCGR